MRRADDAQTLKIADALRLRRAGSSLRVEESPRWAGIGGRRYASDDRVSRRRKNGRRPRLQGRALRLQGGDRPAGHSHAARSQPALLHVGIAVGARAPGAGARLSRSLHLRRYSGI